MRKLHTWETIGTLKTDGQFRKAYKRNSEDQSKLVDEMIAAGRGHWRNAEVQAAAKQGDAMAIRQLELYEEATVLSFRARNWYGREPYLI